MPGISDRRVAHDVARIARLVYRDIWLLLVTVGVFWALSDIQASRRDSVRASCQEQNLRHDATIIQLDTQLLLALHVRPRIAGAGHALAVLEAQISAAGSGAGPAGRRLVQTHDFTVLLIDALSPARDCEARVKQLVG